MIAKYIILFAVCSVVGWVFESLLAIVKTHAWEQRGFLYGPVCPIYGVGVVAIVLAAKAAIDYAGASDAWWHVALAAFFGSMILEYVTSVVLEKAFHAYWWDYSDMPLNINGRTCIPAACLFTVGGLAAVYIISPAWDMFWLTLPSLASEIAAYVIVILLTVDLTLTISSLTRVQAVVERMSDSFNDNADRFTATLIEAPANMAARISTERDRVVEESAQNIIKVLPAPARLALRRVEGFRLPERPQAPDFPRLMKSLLDGVKQRIPKR